MPESIRSAAGATLLGWPCFAGSIRGERALEHFRSDGTSRTTERALNSMAWAISDQRIASSARNML